ncbi:uncharacterized protein LOC143279904 isoform X2 [Babylonia areolata]|uniref:uncharacterized protein LOC143279904 isoform X2 n=1 Tax=Babylonia areolata TaxID=304850 RepID=UPI003FD139BC
MAASNAPKNDFAPPWLSFPDSNENTRPAGSRSTPILERPRQRREDSYYARYGADYPRPLNRQNSGTDVYDGSKRHSPSHASKHRHHSMEEDYYYYGNYGYLAYYPYADPYPMPFAAQPTSMPRRDAKFPPPSYPRYGQVNGSYPGYGNFDFYPSGEGFSNYGGGGHSSVRRGQYAGDGRGESRESRDSDRSSHEGDDKDIIFNQDFPSLNGADDDTDNRSSRHTSSGGVWDNPPRSRFDDGGSEGKSSASTLYKVMPSKGQRQSPTPAKEILSTQMVRPKPTDKKSQFLKTLRKDMENGMHNGVADHQESNNNVRKGEEEAEVVNGVSELQLDQDLDQQCNGSIKILSSSMEREYSFLFSLGWDPQAETELITEDEKREFLKRSGKVKEEQQRNGRTRVLPKSWSSPQHLANSPAAAPPADMNETLSSSDSSDEDL